MDEEALVMNEQTLLERLRRLPPDKQLEVKRFIEDMEHRDATKRPRRNLMGLCADLNLHISAKEIDEARGENVGQFPAR